MRWCGTDNHPLIIDAVNVFNATIVEIVPTLWAPDTNYSRTHDSRDGDSAASRERTSAAGIGGKMTGLSVANRLQIILGEAL